MNSEYEIIEILATLDELNNAEDVTQDVSKTK